VTDEVLRDLNEDGVLLLTLHRPERGNAWNADMETAYFCALDDAAADPDVRAVVLTGHGKSFCPGMDMQRLDAASAGTVGTYMEGVRRPQTAALYFPKPLIAAVNGACAGIGYIQALMCDVRFTVPNAKWTPALSRRGLNAEDALAWLLPRLVGLARATDLLLSSRIVLGAEAVRLGLATELAEPESLLDAALAYASDVARNCSPVSLALVKRQLLLDAESTLEEARLRSVELLTEAKRFSDYREGVLSFMEKRPPAFEPLPVALQVPLPGPDPLNRKA
jgi:enoyl-CoA hydratase/carnithine racemase